MNMNVVKARLNRSSMKQERDMCEGLFWITITKDSTFMVYDLSFVHTYGRLMILEG